MRPCAAVRFCSSATTVTVEGMLSSGMSTSVVIPPAAADFVAVSKPSNSVPGSEMCACVSTRPGISTVSPSTTISRRPENPASTGPIAPMRPSTMPIVHATSSPRLEMALAARMTSSNSSATHARSDWGFLHLRVAEQLFGARAPSDQGDYDQVRDGASDPRLQRWEPDVRRSEPGGTRDEPASVGANSGAEQQGHDSRPVRQGQLRPRRHTMQRPFEPEEPGHDEHIHRHDRAGHWDGDRTDAGDDVEGLLQARQDEGEHGRDQPEADYRVLPAPARDPGEEVLRAVDGDVEVAVLHRPLVDEQ